MATTAAGRAALVHMVRAGIEDSIHYFGPGMGVNKRTAEALAALGYVEVQYDRCAGMYDDSRRQRAWTANLTDAGTAAGLALTREG